jgi:hypothetical protein
LLQTLRDEIQDYVAKMRKTGATELNHWNGLSTARGRIAKYISELESKRDFPDQSISMALVLASDGQLTAECDRRGFETPRRVTPHADNGHTLMFGKAAAQVNEYLCTYIGTPAKPIVHTANGITTTIELAGAIHVRAATMDAALNLAVEVAANHGYIIPRCDFDVRLLGVAE